MSALSREIWFLARDRAALLLLGLAAASAIVAVVLGLQEISEQRATLRDLIEADRVEREVVAEHQSDWGGAAYYSFHLTYDGPSEFAFAAMGQRDVAPWKHRIRMLALEGQIYETDSSNPVFALTGRFDFAFVASLLAPLFLILLLHDQRSRERAAGRLNLLEATASQNGLWMHRSLLRTGTLGVALVGPLWAGGIIAGSSASSLGVATVIVSAHLLFWWAVVSIVAAREWSSPVNLIGLLGVWILLAVIAPGAIRAGVNAGVSLPDGGDILLTQREAVNGAWDLPKEATFEPFVERHPELAEYAKIDTTFEWKWYYAFQQVGDQKAEELSRAYYEGREKRDRVSGMLALLSPPVLTERLLQSQAQTDVSASLAYEKNVRAYHAELRSWYYPKMFKDEAFERDLLSERPQFGDRGGRLSGN
mgnify:CR=1 FL=1